MATELFHDLYRRAFRLDCSTIHTLNGLTRGMGPGPTTARVKLAESLDQAGADFIDAIDDIARKWAIPKARAIKFMCPGCGSPYCGGAIPFPNFQNVKITLIGDLPKSGK